MFDIPASSLRPFRATPTWRRASGAPPPALLSKLQPRRAAGVVISWRSVLECDVSLMDGRGRTVVDLGFFRNRLAPTCWRHSWRCPCPSMGSAWGNTPLSLIHI
eukprot:9386228-Alexandrium_andersonii.AAC.2